MDQAQSDDRESLHIFPEFRLGIPSRPKKARLTGPRSMVEGIMSLVSGEERREKDLFLCGLFNSFLEKQKTKN
jgi:hypothetical protein